MKFDEEKYLDANPDVALAVANGDLVSGETHYKLFGKKEGRTMLKPVALMSRKDKVLSGLNKRGLGLEIGPSHNPVAPKSDGFNVHTLDHMSAEDLQNKYADHGVYGVDVKKLSM